MININPIPHAIEGTIDLLVGVELISKSVIQKTTRIWNDHARYHTPGENAGAGLYALIRGSIKITPILGCALLIYTLGNKLLLSVYPQ